MTRISSIYHRAHGPAPTGAEAKQRNHDACAEAWHKHGLAVIDPEQVRDDWTRQAIINEANRQYGKRG
ncbi:hypothetical protein [Roseovarius mucosus]|uniref:hypothetical protein n=1 Tax=Roseovarius mucosus TaxID=215743 RepID=UPI0035CF987B